ncbi:MAG TPA: DUF4350 domain-containing protein [Candidatus Baltobacteraceae bacterium]|nr:DUF4350 domain-containing protein [Candidatus Baltobacteraceae bacterium]
MPRRRAADLAAVAIALAAVAILGVLRASQHAVQQSEPSTYDTGVNGYAALYDVLAREGARVERFELPIGELTRGTGTLVLAGKGALSAAAPSSSALAYLDRWVRAGGRLVVLDESPGRDARRTLSLPATRRLAARQTLAEAGCAFAPALRGARVAGSFEAGYAPECSVRHATVISAGSLAAGIAYPHGRGIVVAVTTPAIFDNLHVSQAANAKAAYAILGRGAIAFDERVHGYAAGRTFWEVLPRPVRIAIAVALAAVLLAVIGANLPFAPPYSAQGSGERDSSAYIASLARMLERGRAAPEAIARIAARCERVLANKAGDERARMLLRELRTLQATPRPGPQDVLHAGRIYARVRKDYGC